MGYRQFFVYLMTNPRHTVLYTVVTNSLDRRVWEHKNKAVRGFTQEYNCVELVHFEIYDEVEQAIAREKEIKGWSRAKKNALIAASNPEWKDLANEWVPAPRDPSLRSG